MIHRDMVEIFKPGPTCGLLEQIHIFNHLEYNVFDEKEKYLIPKL
jgi:hypothetical protein